MPKVVIYSTRFCSFCRMAEHLLARKGVIAEKIMVDESREQRAEMVRAAGRTSVPQIFIDGVHVGGYTELVELDREGKLDTMLAGERRANG